MNKTQPQQPQRPPQSNGKNLAVREHAPAVPRRIDNVLFMNDQAWQRLESVAKRAFNANVLPATIKNVDSAFIVALKGVALGLDPLYAMEHMAVINGKATIDGQAMLSLIYQRVPGAQIKVTTPDEKRAVECELEVRRPGHDPRLVRFTFAQAQKAGLTGKPPWQHYPDQMLYWRCVGIAGRTIFPDIIGGLYPHEEMGANVNAAGEIIDAEYTVHSEPTAPQGAGSSVPTEPQPSPANPAHTEGAQGTAATQGDDLDKPTDPPTQRQLARLFAIANTKGWSHDDIRNFILGEFKKDSTKLLNWAEYERTVKFIEAHPIHAEEGAAQ